MAYKYTVIIYFPPDPTTGEGAESLVYQTNTLPSSVDVVVIEAAGGRVSVTKNPVSSIPNPSPSPPPAPPPAVDPDYGDIEAEEDAGYDWGYTYDIPNDGEERDIKISIPVEISDDPDPTIAYVEITYHLVPVRTIGKVSKEVAYAYGFDNDTNANTIYKIDQSGAIEQSTAHGAFIDSVCHDPVGGGTYFSTSSTLYHLSKTGVKTLVMAITGPFGVDKNGVIYYADTDVIHLYSGGRVTDTARVPIVSEYRRISKIGRSHYAGCPFIARISNLHTEPNMLLGRISSAGKIKKFAEVQSSEVANGETGGMDVFGNSYFAYDAAEEMDDGMGGIITVYVVHIICYSFAGVQLWEISANRHATNYAFYTIRALKYGGCLISNYGVGEETFGVLTKINLDGTVGWATGSNIVSGSSYIDPNRVIYGTYENW